MERDSLGRFVEGNSGGPGRPPRETEESRLADLSEVCSSEKWRAIFERAVEDATNGEAKARDWLSKYLLGDAKQIEVHSIDGPQTVLIEYTDDWFFTPSEDAKREIESVFGKQ